MTSNPLPDPATRARARFWRTVEEATGEEPRDALAIGAPLANLRRRDFLSLMGASLALAAGGCSRPPLEKIVPYRDGPSQQTYGKPVFYATSLTIAGDGIGVLVECNGGRPTKIEGNPDHPGSLGGTDAATQAAILDLWDPDRSQHPRRGTASATFDEAIGAVQARVRALAGNGGDGLALLTGTVRSPSLRAALDDLVARYPRATWHQWDPVNRDRARAGARLAFGRPVDPVLRLDRARVILALDADFLGTMPGRVRHARHFADTRRAEASVDARSRLYVVEPGLTLTGAAADHRWPVRASDVAAAAHALAHAIGVVATAPATDVVPPPWLSAAAADLQHAGTGALVVVGERQPPEVHALAHAINARLGALGNTCELAEPRADGAADHLASLRDLAARLAAGRVDTLVISGANPVYDAPPDFDFGRALSRAGLSLHHGLYVDETAVRCHWHVPAAHALESWGDVETGGGVALQQPCIAPLYDGRTTHELVAALLGAPGRGRGLTEAYWRTRRTDGFEAFFDDALRRGIVPGTEPAAVSAAPPADAARWTAAPTASAAPGAAAVELAFAPDLHLGAGEQANNAWLQECPRPLSQLAWDNAAEMAPALAERLAIRNGDVVQIAVGERSIAAPAWIAPGLADGTIVLTLGYGRTHAGSVGTGRGFDATPLRTSDEPWIRRGASVRRTGRTYSLVSAQTHHRMEGRDLVRLVPVGALPACGTGCGPHAATPQRTLYDSPPQGPYRWAMSIDLAACIGCSACTVACQAENNIPTVGKDEMSNGREMHWIRVDRYFEGAPARPRTVFQPVPCMQCEHAPCEVVCPVEASVHDSQGINVQVYNRCVGTRFCSNNCPYKVRRFNFLQYTRDVPQLDAQRNPEVTVRMRGVMEKCNYCLQRITTARIEADREGRPLRDGEVVTACQAACPTRAIVFGDLADRDSAVSRRKELPLDYALLEELNTRPRTTYLPRIVNPVPALGEDGNGPAR